METRANYTLVGAFTLAVIAGAFAFVYWFAEIGASKQRTMLDIIFSDSVSGLSVGASVLFNGIPVGQVTNIGIRPEDPRQVEVRVKVDNTTPMREDMTAQLEYQGLTGAASISLTGGDPRSPELKAREGDDYPEIFAKRSDFQSLMESARSIASRADELVNRIDRMVGHNEESVNNIFKNIETFSNALASNSTGIDNFLSQIGNSGKSALEEIQAAATSIRKVADAVEVRVGPVAEGLTRFSGSGLQQVQDLAGEARKAVVEFNRLMQSIQRNPQQFIAGPRATLPQYNGR